MIRPGCCAGGEGIADMNGLAGLRTLLREWHGSAWLDGALPAEGSDQQVDERPGASERQRQQRVRPEPAPVRHRIALHPDRDEDERDQEVENINRVPSLRPADSKKPR